VVLWFPIAAQRVRPDPSGTLAKPHSPPVCVCRLQRAFAGKEARKVVKDALHNDKNGTAWTRALKIVDT